MLITEDATYKQIFDTKKDLISVEVATAHHARQDFKLASEQLPLMDKLSLGEHWLEAWKQRARNVFRKMPALMTRREEYWVTYRKLLGL